MNIPIVDGKRVLSQPVIFSCGCGSVIPEAKRMLAQAGVSNVPILTTSSNDSARMYIAENGLKTYIPALVKNTHSVLYNPMTKQYVNLLKAPHTKPVFENIATVARGE